ncbi:MAG: sugar phosphate nucleotidyltransferase [Candidatus Andersenbacteria bacterium]|nr:sugar phosphate nucleotidyltransferase [bacterium]MDZ4225496.1 sugar phosphate nucleotidyltransferase [Candidatus Andersenbacteria bacterium]
MNIVLMAGGGGTRLWPLSRRRQPKQFLDFGTGQTLLERAYERAKTLISDDHIYVATAAEYGAKTRQLLPKIAPDHFFLEPERRDTTAAFASVVLRLAAAGRSDEPMVFMWCDHIFTNEQEFLNDLGKIDEILNKNPQALVLLGHVPIAPETTLGYIEVKEKLSGYDDVWHVKQFREKPDLATAEKFIAAGNFFWNMGYFSLLPSFFLQELRRLAPEVVSALDTFAVALAKGQPADIDSAYLQFPKISIEYTLIEKLTDIIAITGDYGWSDVGNWAAIKTIFGSNGDHSPKGHHIHIDSQDNYVYNTTAKAVSLIGVKDTIVVVTDDAILVTDKTQAHKVKEIVARLEKDQADQLL